MMQSAPHPASLSAGAAPAAVRTLRVEDLVYQAVTVGAILLVLGSLWLF